MKKNWKLPKDTSNQFSILKKKDKMKNFCIEPVLMKFDLVSRTDKARSKMFNKFLF